jgi:hypothetical protein
MLIGYLFSVKYLQFLFKNKIQIRGPRKNVEIDAIFQVKKNNVGHLVLK